MTSIPHKSHAAGPKTAISPTRWLLGSLAILSVMFGPDDAAAQQPRYYAVRMNDNLIGYAITSSDTITKDGRELKRLTSKVSLKVALLGKERLTVLDAETLVDAQTGRPVAYRMTDTTNEVVRHVETEFTDGAAQTWIYRDGDPRGEAVKTPLPAGAVVLGSNNFSHWKALITAADNTADKDTASVPVFLPDGRLIQNFEMQRGKPEEVVLAGKTTKCNSWRIETGDLKLLADARTNQLVRLELPAQQIIELTDESVVKLAQKSQAEEILARHFAQSNVVFDNFLAVNQLSAKIDVRTIGSGVGGDASLLTTAMQEFEGEKKSDHIQGTVSIRRVKYDPETSPAFPGEETSQNLTQWLKPSDFIESDHPTIVTKAAKLTKGAKTRWEAVESVGRWVYKEIAYTIADTPSARLALEKRKGDCGPHSTLMVAMLRSLGIPARLVGGVVYTPTFGGSFGQHAWVEVHMGESGWLALDPTTGEFDQMSATHIKLFEGVGGVIPTSIEVTAFNPPNKATSSPTPAKAKPLAWKPGTEYTFRFTQGDKELGDETFVINEVERNGEKALELTSDIKLKINLLTSLKSNTTLVVAPNGRPLSFNRDLSAGLQKVKMECAFKGRSVHAKISGSQNLERDIQLPEGAYCFDNNLMASWALICSQLTLEPGTPVTIKTFHPSSLQIISLTLTPKAPAKIKVGDQELECYECDVAPIQNTFWITRDGRFVRASQGPLVIELIKTE